jgi:hypothetical protein
MYHMHIYLLQASQSLLEMLFLTRSLEKNWPLVGMLMCSEDLSYSKVVIKFWLNIGELEWGILWVAMMIVSRWIQHGGRGQHDRTKFRITCLT